MLTDSFAILEDFGDKKPVEEPIEIFLTPQKIDAYTKSIKIEGNLPEVLLEKEEIVQILSVFPDQCILSLERFKPQRLDLRQELDKTQRLDLVDLGPKSLALYCGGMFPERCVVQEIGETVEIYLVDSGQTLLCHPSELFSAPSSVLTIPPLAIRVQTSLSFQPGEIIKAKFILGDSLEICQINNL